MCFKVTQTNTKGLLFPSVLNKIIPMGVLSKDNHYGDILASQYRVPGYQSKGVSQPHRANN